jgi:diacylglycerol kinase (ATP)
MTQIGIITNPNSKQNKKHPTKGHLLSYIVGQFGCLETTTSIEDITRVAQQFKAQGITTLGINGGDGTISRTITAFIKVYGRDTLPNILVLRGGTINVLADNLGIRGTPEEILVRMLECQSGLRPLKLHEITTLSIGEQFGFIFGNGFIARYLEEFYKAKTGAIGAVFLIIKIYLYWIFSRKNYNALIKNEDYNIYFKSTSIKRNSNGLAVMISTVPRIPLGFKLFPNATDFIDKFQFISFEMSAGSLPWRLPIAVLRNRIGDFMGKTSRLDSEIIFETGTDPQLYTVDGELFLSSSKKLAISTGPVVKFIII